MHSQPESWFCLLAGGSLWKYKRGALRVLWWIWHIIGALDGTCHDRTFTCSK